jgi:hypothetical protein
MCEAIVGMRRGYLRMRINNDCADMGRLCCCLALCGWYMCECHCWYAAWALCACVPTMIALVWAVSAVAALYGAGTTCPAWPALRYQLRRGGWATNSSEGVVNYQQRRNSGKEIYYL